MNRLDTAVDKMMKELTRTSLDGYEVFATVNKGLTLEVQDGSLDVFTVSENEGLSVRAMKYQRPCFSYASDFLPSTLAALADKVVEGVHVTDPDIHLSFPNPGTPASVSVEAFDENLAHIPVKEKIEQARILENTALTYDSRIKKVRKAALVETTGRVMIANHQGLLVDYKKTFVSGSILVVAENDRGAEMGWDYRFSPFFQRLDMESIGREAAARAVEALGGRPMESGRIPVLLPPRVASEMVEVLSASFAADNVQKGKSMLIGKIGHPVFSDKISIVDDGLYPEGMATSPFDDEGSPHQTNVVVSHGVMEGFLYDQRTANKEGCLTTGNAGRSGIKGPPVVQPTNFYVKNGETDLQALLSSIEKGLYVTDLMGIHTADPISGDFSVGAAGLRIEKGKTTSPVKGIAIAGNILDLLKNVVDVGNDLTFYGSFGSPTLFISRAHVSGTANGL